MPAEKSVAQQVDEIRELVTSATEKLRQVNWAMDSLADASSRLVVPAPVEPRPVLPKPPPVAPVVVEAEAEPELPQRHRRWARGIRSASRGESGA